MVEPGFEVLEQSSNRNASVPKAPRSAQCIRRALHRVAFRPINHQNNVAFAPLPATSGAKRTSSPRSACPDMSGPALPISCCGAIDFVQRGWVFQRGCVAEFFAQIRCAHDATYDFCVSRFRYVAYEHNFFWRERFAKLGGERVF
jgi:hypothetical protein